MASHLQSSSGKPGKPFAIKLLILFLAILLFPIGGCSGAPPDRDVLLQVSTIDALLGGLYDGVMSTEDLQKHGDFGIGAGESLDGELVALDGEFYLVRADGVAYRAPSAMKAPFAAVTFFDTDAEFALPEGLTFPELEKYLDSLLPTPNIFYAVRIEGTFSYAKTRSVPRQTKPYPPLSEVTRDQPTFQFQDIGGTIVGFRCPAYSKGVNVPGYHFHLLNRQKSAGGHLLEVKIKNAAARIDYTPQFSMLLPGSSDFYRLDLSPDREQELQRVEK